MISLLLPQRQFLQQYLRVALLLTLLGGVLSPTMAEQNRVRGKKASANQLVYTTGDPRPTGLVRVARPVLIWRIWPSESSPRVTKVFLTIDGKNCAAVYDNRRHALIYEPTQPLTKGVAHTVRSKVVFGNRFTVTRDWTFTIAPDALDQLPTTLNAGQSAGLAAANEVRRTLGLSPFHPDATLSAAAQAHSQYLARNGRTGHYQTEGLPGFVGATPGERVAAFGYAGDSSENVGVGGLSVDRAVSALFDAPYHRLPFLQPGAPLLGIGFASGEAPRRGTGFLTMEFGAPDTTAATVVVYPANGQRNVPLAWDGQETPNPLRFYASASRNRDVGYVISFTYFPARGQVDAADDRQKIVIKEATLATEADDRPVAVYVNTPASDEELDTTALLIPRSPLQPGTAYRATVTATTHDGKDISRTWRFITAGVARQR